LVLSQVNAIPVNASAVLSEDRERTVVRKLDADIIQQVHAGLVDLLQVTCR
jgi:hypothetical protein